MLLLCQLRHPNLVPLIGYCIDEGENILVCEFMVNGCLYKDHVKLDNILLDEKWGATLSDFMSSKICPPNLSIVRFVYTEEDTTPLIRGNMTQHYDAEFLVSGS